MVDHLSVVFHQQGTADRTTGFWNESKELIESCDVRTPRVRDTNEFQSIRRSSANGSEDCVDKKRNRDIHSPDQVRGHAVLWGISEILRESALGQGGVSWISKRRASRQRRVNRLAVSIEQ
jgi:hypothetical protein